MRRRWLAFLLAALVFPGTPEAADPLLVAPGDLLAFEIADFDADGWPDRAVVAARDDAADLTILMGGTPDRPAEVIRRTGLLWRGLAWGTWPKLATGAGGELIVTHGNDGIGRHRWRESIHLGWRDGTMRVIGYAYEAYDTLEPALFTECRLDHLTGRGLRDGREIDAGTPAVGLAEWQPATARRRCGVE